jgi:hypothetical protein
MCLGYEAGWDVVHPPRERVTGQHGKHRDAGENGNDLGSHGGTRLFTLELGAPCLESVRFALIVTALREFF